MHMGVLLGHALHKPLKLNKKVGGNERFSRRELGLIHQIEIKYTGFGRLCISECGGL